MRFFDEEAMRSYVQTLHGLIERLSAKSKICENKKPRDKLNIREDKEEVEQYETKKCCSNSLSENAPRIQDINTEIKKKSISIGSLSREVEQRKCTFCDLTHVKGKQNCKAYYRICHKCKQYNHFAVVCRSRKSKSRVEKAEKQ